MPPKFQISQSYYETLPLFETEVLDAYADALASSGGEDVLLKHLPKFYENLGVPRCFYEDISQCALWFYAVWPHSDFEASAKWPVVEQFLRHFTISTSVAGVLDVSDIVDIDKLVKCSNRLLRFRDHYGLISAGWLLFLEAAEKDEAHQSLDLQDLLKIKSSLQLDDLGDALLIDMLGCGQSSATGVIFNYKFPSLKLLVNIKDFAEIMGRLGELD